MTDKTPGKRITVALTPDTDESLTYLADITGHTKTDIINRAISLHEFVEQAKRSNCEIIIRDAWDSETLLKILLIPIPEGFRHVQKRRPRPYRRPLPPIETTGQRG